jgi:hypothetical protein
MLANDLEQKNARAAEKQERRARIFRQTKVDSKPRNKVRSARDAISAATIHDELRDPMKSHRTGRASIRGMTHAAATLR